MPANFIEATQDGGQGKYPLLPLPTPRVTFAPGYSGFDSFLGLLFSFLVLPADKSLPDLLYIVST